MSLKVPLLVLGLWLSLVGWNQRDLAAKVYLSGQYLTFFPSMGFVISYIRIEIENPTGGFNVNSCIRLQFESHQWVYMNQYVADIDS